MLKHIRIQANGTVVDADRNTHVTRQSANDGPDRVQWLRVPGNTGTFTVRFASSPFTSGAQDINVPGAPNTASQATATYKYSVLDDSGTVKDDPNVIIES